MKLSLLLLSIALVCGCSSHPIPPQNSQSVTASDGLAVAAAIQANYLDARRNCGSESMPAFLCSGVLFRGTNESMDFHAWNPVPGKTGVSFSYLRKDANFNHMAGADNGFILYPILAAPAGKEHLQVLCSFPIDGYTWIRAQPGCGESTQYPGVSKRCQTQSISTAAQWKAHFDRGLSSVGPVNIYGYVCSFDVRDQMNELSAESFYQSLKAMQLVPASLQYHYNEIIVQAWAQNIPTQLPIQAFFYEQASGLKGAWHDQWDFFRSTGGAFIPIIHMTLPNAVTGSANFTYDPADQYCQPGATACL